MRTVELLDEQLFCDLYDTLKEITTEYDEPRPAELWDEAAVRWKPLLAAKRPELAVEILKEELTERYGETSAFLVLMILMYMLVAMFRPTKESPYHAYCAALAGATEGHPLLKRLWEGVRMTEDKEEQAGHRIGVVTSLLTDMKTSGEAIDLDTIEQCVLRFPTIVLQQRALEQADNLLRGTVWSQRSGIVERKMYAQQKEQQDRQEAKQDKMMETVEKVANKPTTQNILNLELVNKKETNIDKNYGPNIEHNGGTLTMPEGNVATPLPKSDDDK
jgi:hypothetical protein